ncbi:mechanosensitive ion channel family protein [Halorussus caseinilyticus]|uniref:mechanosensitive ion channel family protein n=1 Tax=Halorussus caseinilyticus TaxID=3034025 RepID=UPI0023E7AD0D|nr:mechanosensitive ion channel family protein [Halorussus sp. DT72]
MVAWPRQILSVLEGVSQTEMQLVASALLVTAGVAATRLLAPLAVRLVHETLTEAVVRGQVERAVELVAENVPWRVPAWLFVRALQAVVLGFTGLALLAVWGQFGLLLTLFGLFQESIPVLVQIGLTAVLVLGAYVGTDVLENWLVRFTEQSDRLTKHQEEISIRVLQLVIFTAVGLVVLSIWNVDLSGLLVGAGFLGIVVGMAARQTLGSLIAGFVLMFSRPFEIGDWVEIDDYEGIVTDITITNTRVENFDGEFVIIPNDKVGDSTVINRTKKGRIRLRLDVGIDYDADVETAIDIAEDAMNDVESVMVVPTPDAYPKRFGDSAVVLELRFWIDKPSARRKTKAIAAVVREVKAAYDREGIKIPYPQRELAGREETQGFRVHRDRTPDERREPAETRSRVNPE